MNLNKRICLKIFKTIVNRVSQNFIKNTKLNTNYFLNKVKTRKDYIEETERLVKKANVVI